MTFDIMLPYYGDFPLMQIAVRSVQAQTDPDWRLTAWPMVPSYCR